MDASTITGYAVTITGGLFTLIGGTLVAVMARRSARTATESSERIATQKHDLDAVTAFKETYKDSVAELRQQLKDLRADMAENSAEDRKEILELRARVEEVERDRDTERARNRLMRGYIQELVQVLRDHDMAVPDPPAGLVLEP